MTIHYVREIVAQYRGPRRAIDSINNPAEAAKFIRKVLPDNAREHFVALYLDGANRPVAFTVIATGTANNCPVHPREIFQNAMLAGAVGVVLAHNHPSNELTPSREDRALTQRLSQAAALLGIELFDHLIITEEAFYSFEEAGLLPENP